MPTIEVRPDSEGLLQEIADALLKAGRIVVIIGAGVSTSAGIPDFKSENGLYTQAPQRLDAGDEEENLAGGGVGDRHGNNPRSSGEKRKAGMLDAVKGGDKRPLAARRASELEMKAFFDASVLDDDLLFANSLKFLTGLRLRCKAASPTESHRLILQLRNRCRLIRCYSQNIDQLEGQVGLSTSLDLGAGKRSRFPSQPNKTSRYKRQDGDAGVECVLLHGSLESMRCIKCGVTTSWVENGPEGETGNGVAPECPNCLKEDAKRAARGGRRLTIGRLRPAITLYNDTNHDGEIFAKLINNDVKMRPDLLLVMGTSLSVPGIQRTVRMFAKATRSRRGRVQVVFVNRTEVRPAVWGDEDVFWVNWDCDEWVADLRLRIPSLWAGVGTREDPVDLT